jgi:hypothetical protein
MIHGMAKPVSLFAYHSPRSKEQSPANRSCVGDRYANPAIVPQESDTDIRVRHCSLGKLLDFCQSQLGTCDSVAKLSSALEKTRIPQIGRKEAASDALQSTKAFSTQPQIFKANKNHQVEHRL